MRFSKKIIFIGLALLILALLLANWGVNVWVNKKVPELLSEKNKTPYLFSYKDIHIEIWSGNITAENIVITPKEASKDSLKTGIYSKIRSVQITGFSIWGVLMDNRIEASAITVTNPEIVLYEQQDYKRDDSERLRAQVIRPLQQIISVKNLFIKNGDVKILSSKMQKPLLHASNVNVSLEGIVVSDVILKRKVPFSFDKYAFSCDSIYYKNDPVYHISAKAIQTENSGLSLKDFAYDPDIGRSAFVQSLKKEKDFYTLKAASLEIKNMDAGYKDEKIFFNAGSVVLDKVTADIYRSTIPPNDLSKKKMYNKLLRELKFPMKVDTVLVRNSLLVYEEEIDAKKGPGVITFNDFNLKATNVQSGFGQKKMDDLKIKINCVFMNTSPMKVDWKLNVMDPSDGFRIRGSILKFDTGKLVSFTKPYMNMQQEGIFDEVYFNIIGNDIQSEGDFAIRYHDLKVTLFKKKNPGKKAKLKSAIANLFVKNDSDDKTKNTKVEVVRTPERSFYNFFWRNIMEGLKKTLI